MKFLLLIFATISFSSVAQQTKYFRHLRYNHVSPFIEITGIHPINNGTQNTSSHYAFKYDSLNRISEIINNHYHTEKRHPLASLGVHKVLFTYKDGKEIRTFFDPNNKRISNDRGVYKEVFIVDKNNMKTQLIFYDLDNNLMESNWKIAKYKWQKKKKYIVEKRYNLKNEFVNLSPYFKFGITGIVLNKKGESKANYNLNNNYKPINNKVGVAAYKDVYDSKGNHIRYSYYNEDDKLVMNQWKFAIGEKHYDSLGNNTELHLFDENKKLLSKRNVYSNALVKLSSKATKADTLEIKKRSLGYLKALQELKPNLMAEVLNDSLNKVTIGYDRKIKKQYGRRTTKDQMILFAKNWNKSGAKFPLNPKNEVTILDIYNRIANVKIVSDNWVEYLQFIKLDGKWQIINLIWQHKDVKRYGD